ncbi:MAG: HAMP domain-containing protein, partial [Myxococcaceae bacterium]
MKLRASFVSLRVKTCGLILLVMGTASVPIWIFYQSRLTQTFHEEVDRRGAAVLELLAMNPVLGGLAQPSGEPEVQALLDRTLASQDDLLYLAALDSQRRPLLVAQKALPTEALLEELTRHKLGDLSAPRSDARIRRVLRRITPGAAAPGAGEIRAATYLAVGVRATKVGDSLSAVLLIPSLLLVGAFLAFMFHLSQRVRRMTAAAEAMANGQLSGAIAVEGNDELSRLALALHGLREHTTQVIAQLKEASTALAASSAEVLKSADAQVDRSNRQAVSVTETGATVTQLREIFLQARSKAESVTELARVSEVSSTAGIDAVQQSVRAMEGIREQVET